MSSDELHYHNNNELEDPLIFQLSFAFKNLQPQWINLQLRPPLQGAMWDSRVGEIICGFCKFLPYGQGGTMNFGKLCGLLALWDWDFRALKERKNGVKEKLYLHPK